MSENCNHQCDECGEECSERTADFSEKLNELSNVKKVIGVVSGKGGVGKSLVTALFSVLMNRRGLTTAIMDADITGPSIARIFGIREKASGSELGIFPVKSKTGIRIMSINLLLANDTDPVVWRGPILAGTVKQFWTDVIWDDVDIMFIDMPPGTGDVPLTVFQSIPLDGIVVVASPQDMVSMIVSKAVGMAQMMNIPILGVVENMAFFKCPDCGKEYAIFGESSVQSIAEQYGLKVIGRIPIDQRLSAACDKGMIELFDGNWLDDAADMIENMNTEEQK